MRVEIKCKGARTLPLDDIHGLQGNLKDLSVENYEKFKRDLLRLGFSEPVSVWENNGRFFLLNGHQRLRTLKKMREEGIEVPDELPVSIVVAKSIKEAKEKILSLTSQYGQITREGLYEFIHEADILVEELQDYRFPEINMDDFKEEFFEEPEPKSEPEDKEADLKTCPNCGVMIDG